MNSVTQARLSAGTDILAGCPSPGTRAPRPLASRISGGTTVAMTAPAPLLPVDGHHLLYRSHFGFPKRFLRGLPGRALRAPGRRAPCGRPQPVALPLRASDAIGGGWTVGTAVNAKD